MSKLNLIAVGNLILEKGDPYGAIIANCCNSQTASNILLKLEMHDEMVSALELCAKTLSKSSLFLKHERDAYSAVTAILLKKKGAKS